LSEEQSIAGSRHLKDCGIEVHNPLSMSSQRSRKA
jgi:hypothetical protein